MQLTSCTISDNSFGIGSQYSSPGGGHNFTVDGSGGGLFNATNSPASLIRNCIIAGNKPSRYVLSTPGGAHSSTNYVLDADVSGICTSKGFNLIGIADVDAGTGFTNGVTGGLVGGDRPIDPLLGPLQSNGGPTPTEALLTGSPAIDQGFSFGIHTDQRGRPRPHNYPSIPNAQHGDGSDIGAFELQ